MSLMYDEIISQKNVLNKTFHENHQKVFELSNLIKKRNIKYIEIVARGSSRNSAVLFKYLLESNTDIRVSFAFPSTITKYKGNLNPNSLYIAVSQGGQGIDVKMFLSKAREIGALTLAITNEENTPLNQIADYNLYLKVDKELSMAATKTFTSEMLVLAMLATSFYKENNEEYSSIASLLNLVNENEIEIFARELIDIKNIYVISRGKILGVALETCCKLQETCFVNANAYSSSDFMHGPLALLDKNSSLLFLIPNDEVKDDVKSLLDKANEIGCNTFVIGDDKTIKGSVNLLLPNVNKTEYSFLMTFTIQLLTCFLSKLLGRDPDKSRNLFKYTKTI